MVVGGCLSISRDDIRH